MMIKVKNDFSLIESSTIRNLEFSKMELYLKIRDQLSETDLKSKPAFIKGEFKNLNVDVHERDNQMRVCTLEEYEGYCHVNPRTYLVNEKGNLEEITEKP